ncbi:MAG: hypothetical protein GY807_21130 [Gammaproteobacteria bacterium]|nr:hypothetical protein [Gammaproteobacteria bacterium]
MKRAKGLDSGNCAIVYYAVVFVALVIVSASVVAQPVCFSPEFVKRVSKNVLPASVVREYKGEIAKEIINRINNTGIPTKYVGDHVLYWVAPSRPPIQVVIFNKGCAAVRCLYAKGCQVMPDKMPGFTT